MILKHLTLLCSGLVVSLAGCTREPPPRTVEEFMENPILLEAAVVRCSQNRLESRYEAECVNAREAISRVEAREDAKRAAELEQRSAEKRQALRRAQEAQAEARRRAAEEARRREEEAYLSQFGENPEPGAADNVPLPESEPYDSNNSDGSNAPVVIQPAPESEPATDLDAVREELQRRNEQDGG